MSIEFSQELDAAPIITPALTGLDTGEVNLRPKLLADYTGQEKAKGNLSVYIEAARRRASPWTTPCCTVRRDSARPLWPVSSPTKWG